MHRRLLAAALVCLVPLVLGGSLAVAQEPATEQTAVEEPATPDIDAIELPETSVAELTLEDALALDKRVLTASLRPLRREAVQAELDGWLALLEEQCRRVSAADVRTIVTQDAEAISELSERSVDLEAQRGKLIARVQIVVDLLEEKGGDVEEARAYLDSVVVGPQVVGWHALLSRAESWLTSPDGGIHLGLQLGTAIAILVASWFVGRALASLVGRGLRRMHRTSELLREFIRGAVKNAMVALGLIIALAQLGIEMSPLIAAIGAAGLVVGLALQGTLSNFASGLLIMVYRPFDVGDVVSVAGVTGKIQRMTLVSTALTTFDNQKIYLPNNSVWNDVITNVTESDTRRVDLVFGIDYGDDLQRAQEVLEEVVAACDKVLPEPAPVIKVHELADSSVNFIVRPWVRTPDYWETYWELTRAVKMRFDEAGITIPFPQRTVTMVREEAPERGDRDVLQPAAPSIKKPARDPAEADGNPVA